MKLCEYQVVGDRAYDGHEPGEVFEERAGRGMDTRAVARGAIRLVRVVEPEIQPGSYRLPEGWLSNAGKE